MLETYFSDKGDELEVAAYPGVGLNIPLYVLGVSLNSAYVAAELGLPYAFAGHLAPKVLEEAHQIYIDNFKPSKQLKKPYFILGMLATVAESDEKAHKLFTEAQQYRWNHLVGTVNNEADAISRKNIRLTSAEKIFLDAKLGYNLIGSKETVKDTWRKFKNKYQPDELMVVCYLPSISNLKTSCVKLMEIVKDVDNE